MLAVLFPRPRRIALLGVACAGLTLAFLRPWLQLELGRDPLGTGISTLRPRQVESCHEPIWRGANVAVVEQTRFHDDVIGTVVQALSSVGANYTLYRNELMWGFDAILGDLHSGPPVPLSTLADSLERNELEVVVLVTCDAKFWGDAGSLLEAIHGSDARVLCLVHEVERWGIDADLAMLGPLARADRLGVMTLSRHSARGARWRLWRWAMDRREAWWETVEVGWYAPIFELAPDVVPPEPSRGVIPSRAAVLGRVQQASRDYEGLFRDLSEAITADPKLWGYHLFTEFADRDDPEAGNRTWVEPLPPPAEPFTLHLVGKYDPAASTLRVPPLLNGTSPVVQVESELDYVEFYRLIRSMDVILPAFTDSSYLELRTSAAVPVAMIAKTPVLAHPHLLDGYAYLAWPGYLQSSLAASEITALSRLRRSGGDQGTVAAAPADWASYHAALKEQNACVWTRMLRAVTGGVERSGVIGPLD